MRALLLALAAATAVASPAALAQSIIPAPAALRYCQLRSMGLTRDDAMAVSFYENTLVGRPRVMTNFRGTPVAVDTIDFTRLVYENCPQFFE
jgi:hypothetical protein